jgi:hypothetical protein
MAGPWYILSHQVPTLLSHTAQGVCQDLHEGSSLRDPCVKNVELGITASSIIGAGASGFAGADMVTNSLRLQRVSCCSRLTSAVGGVALLMISGCCAGMAYAAASQAFS